MDPAGGLQRRDDAEHEARPAPEEQGKGNDDGIDADLGKARQIGRSDRLEHLHHP